MLIKIDVRNQTCPVPLIETRKAIRKAEKGDIIEIQGTHLSSRDEIPLAIESLGLKILDNTDKNGIWTIRIEI